MLIARTIFNQTGLELADEMRTSRKGSLSSSIPLFCTTILFSLFGITLCTTLNFQNGGVLDMHFLTVLGANSLVCEIVLQDRQI